MGGRRDPRGQLFCLFVCLGISVLNVVLWESGREFLGIATPPRGICTSWSVLGNSWQREFPGIPWNSRPLFQHSHGNLQLYFKPYEGRIQKEHRSGLKSGFLENSKGLETHSETRVQAPQGLQTCP